MSDNADFMTLTTLAGGSAVELFDAELEKALKNIADVNTPAEKARVIMVQVRITPNAKRELGDVTVSVASKLPSFEAVSTVAYFGRHNGRHHRGGHARRQTVNGEAMKILVETAQAAKEPTLLDVGGVTFSSRELYDTREPTPHPPTIALGTLTGLVDYVTRPTCRSAFPG